MINAKSILIATLNELRKQWNSEFVKAQVKKDKKLMNQMSKNIKKIDDLIKTIEAD